MLIGLIPLSSQVQAIIPCPKPGGNKLNCKCLNLYKLLQPQTPLQVGINSSMECLFINQNTRMC